MGGGDLGGLNFGVEDIAGDVEEGVLVAVEVGLDRFKLFEQSEGTEQQGNSLPLHLLPIKQKKRVNYKQKMLNFKDNKILK